MADVPMVPIVVCLLRTNNSDKDHTGTTASDGCGVSAGAFRRLAAPDGNRIESRAWSIYPGEGFRDWILGPETKLFSQP
jgi:hypothetical protein